MNSASQTKPLYHMGDEIELTGKVEMKHGGEFEEFVWKDGHRAGTNGWRFTAQQVAKNVATSKAEWQDQQAGFRRIRGMVK